MAFITRQWFQEESKHKNFKYNLAGILEKKKSYIFLTGDCKE